MTSYDRNKNRDDETKNIAGQVLTYNSKNFHWLNRKLDLERTMNGLGKQFRKNPIQKLEKTVKTKMKLPHVYKKPLARKRIFVPNSVFSLYFKIRAKKIHAAKPLAFSLHFLFRRDQNHYSNLTSKIMKMCEQILKKRQRPNTIQILWIVKTKRRPKNQEKAIAVRLLNKYRWRLNKNFTVYCQFS